MRDNVPKSLQEGPAIDRLWQSLPAAYQESVLGPAIPGWDTVATKRGRGQENMIDLTDVPVVFAKELAWLVWWTADDGSSIDTRRYSRIANFLRWASAEGQLLPGSLTDWPWEQWRPVLRSWVYLRLNRMISENSLNQIRPVFHLAQQALLPRITTAPWWHLDIWTPRCDPRIPIREKEPRDLSAIHWPSEPSSLWPAAKWQLSTQMSTGGLGWSTVVRKVGELVTWSRWIASVPSSADFFATSPGQLRAAAAGYRVWLDDPANRPRRRDTDHRRVKNDYFRAIDRFFSFMLDYREEAAAILEDPRWLGITEVHAAVWRNQQRPYTAPVRLQVDQFIDDTAMAQIAKCIPVLGAPLSEEITVELNGKVRSITGFSDPQAMRILLLQFLTGRRKSEILLMGSDPLTSVDGLGASDENIARMTYAQTKIDGAPNSILVNEAVVEVIRQQQGWLRTTFPDCDLPYLFVQRKGNRNGYRHYAADVYERTVRAFANTVQIHDSKGAVVDFNRTHRFRHTRMTKLAELNLPIHVLQRYAGHRSPTMSMHYVAQREEFAEQAFLATQKFYSDGRQFKFTTELHDGMHLFERADRFLPHGYCLLPPAQSCDKGNACLTCSDFVTDSSHLGTLKEQLLNSQDLLERRRTEFQSRTGHEMPDHNIWAQERLREIAALEQLIATLETEVSTAALRGGGTSARQQNAPVLFDPTKRRKAAQ
jgi:integrase